MTLYSELDIEDYYESIAIALLKKKGSAKFPTNEDLKTALQEKDLYNTQPKNRSYLFEKLENYNNREHVDTSSEKITIEHIFPRNPNLDWENDLTEENYRLFKEKYLNTIGNLTLSGNNGNLSNRSFLAKKEMNTDGNEEGYSYSRLWLNSYLKTISSWDISKYEERSSIIYQRFLNIWEYPNVEITEVDDSIEQNIFDAESPTFKKLEYFIFENTKIEEDAIAQMYFYVIRNLYQKNIQLLINNQEILKISRTSSDFRSPQELVNGWFIETNIDSNSKFNILKKLLTLYEMEDDLFIKFMPSTENLPNRYILRKKYWQQLLPLINISLFSNINPTKDHWLGAGAGISGLSYTLVITRNCVRIELGIINSNKEKNKTYFKKLLRFKDEIEDSFGEPLEWELLPENKMSRVKFEEQGVNYFNENDWEKMNDFFIYNLSKFESAFQHHIQSLK
ncbi:hypothetical protein BH23BAC1_BH23BAC1_48840 [soil metagenome]